ncbi:serine hydrolase [Myxococcota bacterium]|nr:serine hydrolase [Myxococcota bacterium]MBU1382845.1 serine hydrolase [Myxococcota bacterium]MBU1498994.1 serine hydrolase [Myxococcota bacterium]
MKSIVLMVVIIFTSCVRDKNESTVPEKQVTVDPRVQKLDVLMSAFVEKDKFSGVVLAMREDKVLYGKAFGYANRQHEIPNTMDTKFRIGSVTKQFTSALVLKLVEAGKISLEDKLDKFIPDYPTGNRITVRHLLSHTSGIVNFTDDKEYPKIMSQKHTMDELINLFKSRPLEFEPGSKFKYCNSGYILLTFIIEKVTGKSYDKALAEIILKPAGLNNTGYAFNKIIIKKMASGYSIGSDGNFENASFNHMSIPQGAGGMYSTAPDLCKWDRALRNGSILNENSLKELYTPVKGQYALGWIVTKLHDSDVIMHGGGINGFVSYFLRYTADKTCIVVLSNNVALSPQRIGVSIGAAVHGKPYKIPRIKKEINLEVSELSKYTGTYVLEGAKISMNIALSGKHLTAQVTGQRAIPVFAEKKDNFFLKVVDAEIVFIWKNGKIEKLILHQGGRSSNWIRQSE